MLAPNARCAQVPIAVQGHLPDILVAKTEEFLTAHRLKNGGPLWVNGHYWTILDQCLTPGVPYKVLAPAP